MATQDIAAALARVETVLGRRPDMGMHDDAPATVRWDGGTRMISCHQNGTEMLTDMPPELGGSGQHVTPGWLFRAGFASCAATSIAMNAARRGIELTVLELHASSRSDTRGLFAMRDSDGAVVRPGPSDVRLRVRIAAPGIEPQMLRELVQDSLRCSPIPSAVREEVPVQLQIEVEPG